MRDELRAFAQAHGLSADVAGQLEALVDGLLEDDRRTVYTTADPGEERRASRVVADRYVDLGPLGEGGMGEVRRVKDAVLGRTCAYKVVRAGLEQRVELVERFRGEARVAAQLQHPNIAPVYDAGVTDDGRPWFTMKEVRGRTLAAHLADPSGPSLRWKLDVFAKVCDAVGYAHSRGVVHRDLKPANVMIGAFGEVLVLDWGIAKVLTGRAPAPAPPEADDGVVDDVTDDRTTRTRVGRVMGTPGYMSPEQHFGDVELVDARSDVYALGAILHELLTGARPERPRFRQPTATDGDDLQALAARCLAWDLGQRPANAGEVGEVVRAWLDDERRRERAAELVAEAVDAGRLAAETQVRADALARRGDDALDSLPAWETEEVKDPAWALQDDAARHHLEASLLVARQESLLRAALTHAPELAEAHAGLVELQLAHHRAAELSHDEVAARRALRDVEAHHERLPDAHPLRHTVAAYLRGDGALTLVTEQPGLRVTLERYTLRGRRLVAVPERELGVTPLRAVSLPLGSYVCRVHPPDGRPAFAVPVHIDRGAHWDGAPPGSAEPLALRLPAPGELGPEDVWVPPGWFRQGGDPDAVDGHAQARVWCDDLVVRRFPVRLREYAAWLCELVAAGQSADAERLQPRERGGAPVLTRADDGRYVIGRDSDGDPWDPEWPVVLVDWVAADAYAAWEAARQGDRRWRLLADAEWEKAARGVDGRLYPWGDFADPAFARMRRSRPGRPLPDVVDSWPIDVSPYGVRGLGGNVQDWCADLFQPTPVVGDRVAEPPPADPATPVTAAQSVRGGFWLSIPNMCRSAQRFRYERYSRTETLGFRLARRR